MQKVAVSCLEIVIQLGWLRALTQYLTRLHLPELHGAAHRRLDEGVNPAQPLVRGGHGHQCGLAPAHAGIHGSPALDGALDGHGCRCDVLPDARLSPPNLARHDHLGLPGNQFGCRQAREECLVQIANGSQAVQRPGALLTSIARRQPS